jgi:hypothetical protein
MSSMRAPGRCSSRIPRTLTRCTSTPYSIADPTMCARRQRRACTRCADQRRPAPPSGAESVWVTSMANRTGSAMRTPPMRRRWPGFGLAPDTGIRQSRTGPGWRADPARTSATPRSPGGFDQRQTEQTPRRRRRVAATEARASRRYDCRRRRSLLQTSRRAGEGLHGCLAVCGYLCVCITCQRPRRRRRGLRVRPSSGRNGPGRHAGEGDAGSTAGRPCRRA